jgi:hypothetical protein
LALTLNFSAVFFGAGGGIGEVDASSLIGPAKSVVLVEIE